MNDDPNKRSTDPMAATMMSAVSDLKREISEGFRVVNNRVDQIYTQVGEIKGLAAKVDGFVALMEKIDERANHELSEQKKTIYDHEVRLRSLESTIIKPEDVKRINDSISHLEAESQTRAGGFKVVSTVATLGWRHWLGPILVALMGAYIFNKESAKPVVVETPIIAVPTKVVHGK